MKNNYNLVDLHIHTKYSDGTDDVDGLLKEIDRKSITIFSVTDHDTVDFYKNLDYSKLDGVRLIPGIEFSCKTDAGKCHILGYGIDVNNPVLQNTIEQGQKKRSNKLTNRLKYLEEYHHIVFDDITKALLAITPSVGKPHIAEQIVRMKKAESITEAIDSFLTGIPGDADDKLDAKVAIDSIVAAGGIPIWAHPLGGEGEKSLDIDKFNAQLNCLVEKGIQGVECYYSSYTEADYDFIKSRLIENDYSQRLYLSGGSDYHGKVKNIELGTLNAEHKCVTGIFLTILRSLGIENDDRYDSCTIDETKYLCTELELHLEGKVYDKCKEFKGSTTEEKKLYLLMDIFEKSSAFCEKFCENNSDWYKWYQSNNGIINIQLYDSFHSFWQTVIGDSNKSCYENHTIGLHDINIGHYKVRVIVSNLCDDFIDDILGAFKKYFGFQLYYEVNRTKNRWLYLLISDGPKKNASQILQALEDAEYYTFLGIILMKKDGYFYQLLSNGNWEKDDFHNKNFYNEGCIKYEIITKDQLIEIIKKRYID